MVLIPVEYLSHEARKLTPLPLCLYLVGKVLEFSSTGKVAVLWVEPRSNYWKCWPTAELWGKGRNANLYAGPHPVICHPPCGAWGNYKAVSRQPREDGIRAMELVHLFGGVVEQPVGSCLFKEHGQGGKIEKIEQADFGHPSRKRTLLYWVDSPCKR